MFIKLDKKVIFIGKYQDYQRNYRQHLLFINGTKILCIKLTELDNINHFMHIKDCKILKHLLLLYMSIIFQHQLKLMAE